MERANFGQRRREAKRRRNEDCLSTLSDVCIAIANHRMSETLGMWIRNALQTNFTNSSFDFFISRFVRSDNECRVSENAKEPDGEGILRRRS